MFPIKNCFPFFSFPFAFSLFVFLYLYLQCLCYFCKVLSFISLFITLTHFFSLFVQKRVYHKLAIPMYVIIKFNIGWNFLSLLWLVKIIKSLKGVIFYLYVYERWEVRKHFAVWQKIIFQLIFYVIISIICTYHSLALSSLSLSLLFSLCFYP